MKEINNLEDYFYQKKNTYHYKLLSDPKDEHLYL